MKTAPVRELKNRLSSYLRLVKAGETVIVSEHGRVIAELRQPASSADSGPAQVERVLARLEQEGRLRRAALAGSSVEALTFTKNPAMPDWRKVLEKVR